MVSRFITLQAAPKVVLYSFGVFALSAGVASAADESLSAVADSKPNILVIVADDLGYGDVGFNGGKQIPTPHIDSIAKGGVQFSNGYVSCPVCSPTRAGLVTGRYQQRFGHEFNPGAANQADRDDIGLPLTETTIADALRTVGYRTAIIGKWHLGGDTSRHPLRRGFDHFYGFLGGAHPYFPSDNGNPGGPIYRDDYQVDAPPHLTSEFGKRAAEYVRQESDSPFLLYLTFNAVHNPLQPEKEHLKRFAHITDERRRAYAALLSGLDDAIGEVLAALNDSNKLENTLVFFISDNGGPQDANSSDNTPLSGNKGSVLEGGIHVPFLIQWKGKLPAGTKFNSPVISLDIPATVAGVAGAELGSKERPVDGVDLIPFITGKAEGEPHDNLYWRFGAQHAIRQGDFKLRQQGNEAPRLFNLASDIGEKKNIANEHPELVKSLEATYAEWNSQLAEPLWKGRSPAAKQKARETRRAARRNGTQLGKSAETIAK